MFLKYFLFILTLTTSSNAFTAETKDQIIKGQCDGAKYEATLSGEYGSILAELTVKGPKGQILEDQYYDSGVFRIKCLKSTKGKMLIVFQDYCSGSACKDLDNWGIIDPITTKILLKPSDSNQKQFIKIFGKSLPPLSP